MGTLWSKGTSATQIVEDFTVGNDRVLDLRLAKHDVMGSKAHIKMLESIGLLEKEELETLTAGLDAILDEIARGEFVLGDDVEDIHSQVEFLLTQRFGEIGKKIHSGRSRNDQVLVDLKLFLREELEIIRDEVVALFDTLQALSEKYKNVLLPGYTHAQSAMPSSFGLWFGAYAEAYLKIFGLSVVSFIERMMIGFEEEMSNNCIGTISELFDGNPPFTGRGGISYAVNVAEILRVLNLMKNYNNNI